MPHPQARKLVDRAKIEIGVLKGQCLALRLVNCERLERKIAARERERNAAGAKIKWMFTTEQARAKMGHAYPNSSSKDPRTKES